MKFDFRENQTFTEEGDMIYAIGSSYWPQEWIQNWIIANIDLTSTLVSYFFVNSSI